MQWFIKPQVPEAIMAKKTPQDRVGHKVPSPEEIKELRERLLSLLVFARSLGPSLTKEERKRVSKPRKGSEGHVGHALTLAQAHRLGSRNYSVDGIKSDLALFTVLENLVKEAYLVWSSLRDVYLEARSEYWDGFLHFHGALSHLAESDAEVAAEIAPLVEFMSIRSASPEEPQTGEDGLE
jgi:hypothetical protein